MESAKSIFEQFKWHCEPAEFKITEQDSLTVKTQPSSDFWRKTHYGFIRDNGHLFYKIMDKNFQATVSFIGTYKDLYDHAGFMIRVSEENWLKCGIEEFHGVKQASTVVTNDYSDWSVTPLPKDFGESDFHLKIVWQAPSCEVFYRIDSTKEWTLMRICYLKQGESKAVQFGMMACSPDGSGFNVEFKDFNIEYI